jgi:hypothetical protein
MRIRLMIRPRFGSSLIKQGLRIGYCERNPRENHWVAGIKFLTEYIQKSVVELRGYLPIGRANMDILKHDTGDGIRTNSI